MSNTREWIEQHIRKAEEEIEEGRYDNAEAELETVSARIKKEAERIKGLAPGENMEDIASNYRVLSELKAYLTKATSKLEIVKAEKDRSRRFRSVVKGIHEKRILDIIKKNQEAVAAFRDRDRTIKDTDRFIKILRRWNSYTPLLNLDPVENLGGGYFLAWDGTGIVVDPGINFIKNAVSSGLSLKDINIIVLTHSHVDHTSDFEGLVTLFHEINTLRYDLGLDPIQFSLYTSIGAMNKYCNLVSFAYDIFKEVNVVNPGSSYQLSDSIRMKTTPCQHQDLFCSHSSSCVGLKFYTDDEEKPSVSITSDTGYNPQLKEAFADVEGRLVILHIGGIISEEMEYTPLPNIPVYESHLGLRGILNFVFDVKPSIAIISEFGEEFKGVRMSLSDLFDEEFKDSKVIPADVGFTIEFVRDDSKMLVKCSKCQTMSPIAEIQPKLDGYAIVYICPNCRKE